jgi:hypothetical protein
MRDWLAIIVVAAFSMGAIIGASRLRQARTRFQATAQLHVELLDLTEELANNMDDLSKSLLAQIEMLQKDPDDASNDRATLEGLRYDLSHARKKFADYAKEVAYHEEMVRKYQEAARYPWRSVTRDPAEP